MRISLRVILGVAAACGVPAAAVAQVNYGLTAGAAKLSDTRTERALTAVLQFQTGWLTLSALPAVAHVSDGALSSTGLAASWS